jgi:ribonucleoside-triphosphate reductase
MKFIKALNPSFVEKYRSQVPPWGEAGYVTYKRTYARHLDDDQTGPREEFWQTLTRCIDGLLHIGGPFTQEEAETLFDDCFNLRGMLSGRHLWQLGTRTVDKLGGDSLQACWHIVVNEPIHPFTFAFDKLMLGGGVGFNIQRENVYELPKIQHDPIIERVPSFDCDFIVTDNREGWVELIRKILASFFGSGRAVYYNTDCIRERGKPIKSFGGVASGSEELVKGIKLIVKILRNRYGSKLQPIDCLDIMNIIGMIVVSGNVRRSAEIGCGDPDDIDFINAKNWHIQTVPPWRQQSNNTVITAFMNLVHPDFWEGYYGRGEALGLWNPHTCRNYGRLFDGFIPGVDRRVKGPNPCGEITLESDEACNLAELYLPNIRDAGELRRVSGLLLKAQKTISVLPFLHDRTNEVVRRNHRIGLGITGWYAAHHLRRNEILDSTYGFLKEEDVRTSKLLNTGLSIKLTTAKPSGTASLLPRRIPAGINAGYSPYHIRRIGFAASDPLVDALRSRGYKVEPKLNIDGSHDFNQMLVSFPIGYGTDVICDKDVTAIEQLDNQKRIQTWWADNSVSATIQYEPHEVEDIQNYLDQHYHDEIKSVSFCMHQHGFLQAPLEEITREEYLEYSAKVTPLIQFENDGGDYEISNQECGVGGCPVR